MIHVENGKVQHRGNAGDILAEATIALKYAAKAFVDKTGMFKQPEAGNLETIALIEAYVDDIKTELLGDRAETEQERIHSLLCKIDSLAEDHYNRERNEGKSHDQARESTARIVSNMLTASTVGIKMMINKKASRTEEESESCEEEEKSGVSEL